MEVRGMEETEYEKWFKSSGWDIQYNVIARSAWDAAILECAKLVKEKFDEQEPWLTVDEVGELNS